MITGTCSADELQELVDLLGKDDPDPLMMELVHRQLEAPLTPEQIAGESRKMKEILDRILPSEVVSLESSKRRSRQKRLKYLTAAATILLVIAGGTLYFSGFYNRKDNHPLVSSAARVPDVQPGSNKAVLTLSGGQRIILNSAHEGQIARQGNARVIKMDSGLLAYRPRLSVSSPERPDFNMLTTPRGGQYRLQLPDGTEVWLNAASSIRFPVNFTGTERRVEVRGEAYFEVAPDPGRPFSVTMGSMQVEVLGTRFNINGYGDEIPVKTTLLEGSIRVSDGSHRQLLKPEQQAQLREDGSLRVVNDVDIRRVTAWKNGYFSFDKADLKTVMNTLARWYNVEVRYQGKIPPQEFGGEIQKGLTLSQVLVILQRSQVHFKINGAVLTVTP